MKSVVIVAHPDDEVIWCGGLIMKNPDWDWTILSLCRADDPDRGPKFHKACKSLAVSGSISDLNDTEPLVPISPRREIGRRIIHHVGKVKWDLCLTHGPNGEYGHQRHREIHKEVFSLIVDGILDCEQLWTFDYQCDAESRTCRANPRAEILIDLSEEILSNKRRIITDVYGYGEDSFECAACVSPEGFHRNDGLNEENLR